MLRLGTRASRLARWQAEWVAAQLADMGVKVDLVPMTTQGDAWQSGPVRGMGEQGLFTKTIQQALLEDKVDLAVHSLKDLPTEPVAGLVLAAVPDRAAVGDALVSRQGNRLERLAPGAVVGTGSLRRQAQLRRARPDVNVADLRGNVETRLRQLDQGDYDAIVLAVAGLERLGLAERITQILSSTVVMPAPGQGALGIETRADDASTREAVAALDHAATHQAVLAERAVLASLRGGCQAPVGAWGRVTNGRLRLSAVVLSRDGTERIEHHASARPEAAAELGRQVGRRLIALGASRLIEQSRQCH